MLISLAAGTVLDAPATEVLHAAATAGYDACGLRLDPRETIERDAARLSRLAEELGLQLLDLEVVRLGTSSWDDHLRLLDLADVLGVRYLLTVSEHTDHARTVEDVGRLHAAMAGRPTRLALEFMRFTAVPTLDGALDVLDAAEARDAVVLLDALHLARSGHQPSDVAAAARERIGYVQVCDGPAVGPADDTGLAWEARHDRRSPGEGDLPLADLLDRVPDVPISVEVQSDELSARFDPATRAARLLASTRTVLDRLTCPSVELS